jgi:Ni,Fe-hydrogenase III small subunit
MSLIGRIVRTGRVAEPTPDAPDNIAINSDASATPTLSGSVQLRHVDAGSCNGCELEIASAFGPVYDAERYGLRLVASPRHADALLVTGPVTRNMADPLRKTYEATPAPKRVVAVGDCALNCGVFAGGHGVEGSVGEIVPVDVEVPGCPPTPEVLIAALRGLTGR